MSKFQIALLVVFGVFIVIAVIIFSRSRGGTVTGTTLTVWGTLNAFDFNNVVTSSGIEQNKAIAFNYVPKSPDTISSDFTEALAEGNGPDLIIIPADNLISEKTKLFLIPNQSVKPADFVSTFIKEGNLFETSLGTYALPMYVDPMVMYWNRDMLAKATLSVPPVYWDQIYNYISRLSIKDGAGNITQSAMALGESSNIPHAKEILSLLMLQAGTPITAYVGDALHSVLLEGNGATEIPSIAALDFYTQFADPQKSFYSWNRSLTEADTNFTSGKSAMYLGFASELPILKAKNPTMDLGVSPVPQSRTSTSAITFGELYGVAISRNAKNIGAALSGALLLVSNANVKTLSADTPLIPARRDILSTPPTDPAGFTFYGAALQSSGWVDPDSAKSRSIFNNMIDSVTSGQARSDAAIGTGSSALDALISQTK